MPLQHFLLAFILLFATTDLIRIIINSYKKDRYETSQKTLSDI